MARRAVIASAAASLAAALPAWASHGWDTVRQGAFIDFGYAPLSSEQATFVASNYAVVSLEKCTGEPTEVCGGRGDARVVCAPNGVLPASPGRL